ncbi:MAG TPA: GAF domain-containing protein [Pantanalinema sp.]
MINAVEFIHPIDRERLHGTGDPCDPRHDFSPEVQGLIDELSAMLRAAKTSDEAFELLVDHLGPLLPFDRIAFSVIDPATQTLAANRLLSNHPVVWHSEGVHLDWGSSLGPLMSEGAIRIIHDLKHYQRLRPSSEATRALLQEGMRSSLAVPLYHDGEPLGFLFLTSAAPEAYTTQHAGVAIALAPVMGQALGKPPEEL